MTTGPGPDESPTVSTDGAVAFVNSRWRNTLEVHDLDALTSRVLVTHSPYLRGPAVSPDGREIAFSRSEVDGSWHIWTVSSDGGAMTFLPWNQGEGFAELSPDGQTIAFTHADAATERVYLAAARGGDPRLLTTLPGAVPHWVSGRQTDRVRRESRVLRRHLHHQRGRQWRTAPDGRRRLAGLVARRPPARVPHARPFAVFPDGKRIAGTNAVHVSDEIWLLAPRKGG